MSAPLSFCDISARYGQAPTPRKTPEEQTGWNLSEVFRNYMLKVRRQNQQAAKEAEEDALMAVIDAMVASKEERAKKSDLTEANSLVQAGRAIAAQSEEIREDGTRRAAGMDPLKSLTVQVLISCLGDRFTFEQETQENAEKLQEQKAEEKKRLDVTEARDPSDPYNKIRR